MQRIFLGLAAVAVLLLAVNVFVGLTGGDYNAVVHEYVQIGQQHRALEASGDLSPDELAAARQRRDDAQAQVKLRVLELQPHMTRHMLLGILSALITLLVCSISITYFVGTSRWFKEVVETYRLDRGFVDESAQIKRRSFRWSTAGALAILAVVGLGAASEPTWANAQHSPGYVVPHYLASLVVIAFLLVSFYMQAVSLADNGRLIERVMEEVRRVRRERGLQVEPTST